MVKFSAFIPSLNASIPISVQTEKGLFNFILTGPVAQVEVPGNRILGLEIIGAEFFNVNVVADGEDFNLWNIIDFADFQNVESVSITAAWETNFCAPLTGFTVNPIQVINGRLALSGKSYVFSGCQCDPKFLAGV